jgi:uncharacterized protein GlcG (DUF336 family)
MRRFPFAAAFATAFFAAAPLHAELPSQKILSTVVALNIAQTAFESCLAQGHHVSVTVVGGEGQTLISLRGDGTSPHTIENSFRKAYTSRTFRVPSGEIAQRVKDNPTLGLVHLNNVVANQGALPIKVGETVVGGVGVSGAPGGDKDEACAKAALDKIADQLK